VLLATELIVDGQTDRARILIDREIGYKRIANCPSDWQAMLELGLLELEQFHNLQAAQALFSRACELNPRQGLLWFQLGLTVFRLGQFEESEKFLKQAAQRGYSSALLEETRGDALYNLGRFSEARYCFGTALEMDPGNPTMITKLSLANVCSGRTKEGLERLRTELEGNPHAAELHEGLILSLVYLNRLEEAALSAQHKLNVIGNSLAGDYLRTASLWAQLQQWDQARQSIERGLRTYPNDTDLQRARRELAHLGDQMQPQFP
jgi:tetratricopeptide (TPR) repeat protein